VVLTSHTREAEERPIRFAVHLATRCADRLVHRAEVVALNGDYDRLKDRDLGRVAAGGTEETELMARGSSFQPSPGGQFSRVVDR